MTFNNLVSKLSKRSSKGKSKAKLADLRQFLSGLCDEIANEIETNKGFPTLEVLMKESKRRLGRKK